MDHEPYSDPVTSLQEETRRASREIDALWRHLPWPLVLVLALAGAVAGAATLIACVGAGMGWSGAVLLAFLALAGSGVAILTAWFLLVLPATSVVRRDLYRRKLRYRLATLPREDRAAVLLPLRANGLTQEIVAPIARELRIENVGEVTPAAAPDGRGNEVSADRPCGKMPQ